MNTTRTLRSAARSLIFAAAAVMTFLFAAADTAAARGRGGDTLRILAIGNSFSDDAMEYLPALLDNLGVENVSLARIYVAGCSLERHIRMYNNDEAAYQYYRSEAGRNRWVEAARNVSLRQALADGEELLVILAHGGTQMAALERYALPHKDYYEWCGPNAGGYVLDARDWPTQHILHLVKTVQYTKEGRC